MAKVFVQTLPRESAFKVHEQKDPQSQKSLGKTKISEACKDGIPALWSASTRRRKTGLNKLVDNPYYSKDGKNPKVPKEFQDLIDQDKILKQHVFEIKHGKPRGFYTDVPSVKGSPKTFFDRFKYKLNDGTTTLDLSNPIDEIAYEVFKESKYIANSKKEYAEHIWPRADFVLTEPNESEREMYQKKQTVDKAKAALVSMDNLTQEKVAKILGLVKGKSNPETIYSTLSSYIETASLKNMSPIDEFNDLVKLLSTKKGREEVDAKALLEDLIYFRIVGVRQNTYKWLHGDIVIGQRKPAAVSYLLDPAQQPEVDEMKAELKAKTG